MEYLDIVDQEGNPTGETIERTIAHEKGIPHRTSHVWLVREKQGKTQILLQKRSQDKDSYPGHYDISSAGHIPAGCGYEESAIRELKEELGISAGKEELVYCGKRQIFHDEIFYGKPFIDRQVSNVYYIERDLEEDRFQIQKEELENVCWINLKDCIHMVENQTIKSCIALEELYMVEKMLSKERK